MLRTPPPHICSSEEILPRLTRRTIAQLRTKWSTLPQILFTQGRRQITSHHHYAPSVTLTHTTHIISSTATTYAPHCHPWICWQTPPEWLHCWPDGRRKLAGGPQAGTSDSPPPLARVMGVGWHQQEQDTTLHMRLFEDNMCTINEKKNYI